MRQLCVTLVKSVAKLISKAVLHSSYILQFLLRAKFHCIQILNVIFLSFKLSKKCFLINYQNDTKLSNLILIYCDVLSSVTTKILFILY